MLHRAEAMVVFSAALGLLAVCGDGQSGQSPLAYYALECPLPTATSTWEILDRDGANRQVPLYLSSLGQGESGTGVISSPPFVVATDAITFTICGHDGQAGGRGENYIALVDARKGNVLLRTPPPQNDAMHERRWDVRPWRGQQVRVEIHDGNSTRAYAWLGVGSIDAGESLRVDFRKGIPDGWLRSERAAQAEYEVLSGPVPFRRNRSVYSLVPKSGSVEILCGFAAERIFFLGCTVAGGKPAETYGSIEIHYRSGPPEVFPLVCGFTLEAQHRLLSRSAAMYLHPTVDPFQYCLAVAPRDEVIEKISLSANPAHPAIPRITAITCATSSQSERLTPLPAANLSPEERAWLESHTVTAHLPDRKAILDTIRKAHRLPPGEGACTEQSTK